ncbi:MAG: ABC transporter ATP-binding protein [Acidobacteria bacterium]|nr:ABC transporter ATP-binding protein [Acidobacteriota bacterium]MCB9397347.1 ABC transporter ATP-binding protein [Acidobacteriota bacterium]
MQGHKRGSLPYPFRSGKATSFRVWLARKKEGLQQPGPRILCGQAPTQRKCLFIVLDSGLWQLVPASLANPSQGSAQHGYCQAGLCLPLGGKAAKPCSTLSLREGTSELEHFLEFRGVSKFFGKTKAVDHVDLAVQRGEIFSLLGPSGCGKTTLLRMVAGFEKPDSGSILLNGEDITHVPPHRRKVNTIFQNYALFPHMSVRHNIAFGPKTAKWSKAETDQAVDHMLHLVQLAEHAEKRISQLSGGQKQRVAIARALILKPQVLLLDEPLAALDLKLRQHMLMELDQIHDEVGITFLFVTHDQGEAMSLSDRIAVMNKGRIEQIGTPSQIYEAPHSSFVAAFIGDANFLDGTVANLVQNDYSSLRIKGFPDLICFNDKRMEQGKPVHWIIRPEKIGISAEEPSNPHPLLNRVQGVVEDVVYLGSQTKFWVQVEEKRIMVLQQHRRFLLDEKPIKWGDSVHLFWHADDGYMLDSFQPEDQADDSKWVSPSASIRP